MIMNPEVIIPVLGIMTGILIFASSGILTASYYFGDKKNNNILYDEYTALRYYKIAAAGYALNGIGIFILFSIQDWPNWNFQNANNMIYQIAAFAWLTFGYLAGNAQDIYVGKLTQRDLDKHEAEKVSKAINNFEENELL